MSSLCLAILSVIFPPLGVLILKEQGKDLLINLILFLLGYFPALIHLLQLMFEDMKKMENV